MTVSQALERLAAYEKQAFAYNHASGVLYYDGATVAPKGSADVRADTLGELSRMSYILTTAPETVEMLQTLVQARDRLDPVTARKVSELWRDYEQNPPHSPGRICGLSAAGVQGRRRVARGQGAQRLCPV